MSSLTLLGTTYATSLENCLSTPWVNNRQIPVITAVSGRDGSLVPPKMNKGITVALFLKKDAPRELLSAAEQIESEGDLCFEQLKRLRRPFIPLLKGDQSGEPSSRRSNRQSTDKVDNPVPGTT